MPISSSKIRLLDFNCLDTEQTQISDSSYTSGYISYFPPPSPTVQMAIVLPDLRSYLVLSYFSYFILSDLPTSCLSTLACHILLYSTLLPKPHKEVQQVASGRLTRRSWTMQIMNINEHKITQLDPTHWISIEFPESGISIPARTAEPLWICPPKCCCNILQPSDPWVAGLAQHVHDITFNPGTFAPSPTVGLSVPHHHGRSAQGPQGQWAPEQWIHWISINYYSIRFRFYQYHSWWFMISIIECVMIFIMISIMIYPNLWRRSRLSRRPNGHWTRMQHEQTRNGRRYESANPHSKKNIRNPKYHKRPLDFCGIPRVCTILYLHVPATWKRTVESLLQLSAPYLKGSQALMKSIENIK